MAKLSFRVEADYEKVQRLRDEITKLKQEIKGVDVIQDPTSFNKLNSKLQQTSKELGTVTGKIAEASAAMETDFKQKIFAASQGVNDFTEKIIAQKGVVRDVAADVKRLGESYRESVKSSPLTSDAKLAEWKAAKKALDEEKASLFALTQEQATARLSVKKLRDEYASLRQEGGGTAETMAMITGKLKQMSGMLLGGMGLKELASRIISVRAEFESMETSLKVLLGGNEERLNNIMGQIKEYALASPLNTKDMVGAVQMMTSFGIEAEKSIDYLKAIGDISMGDTGKFNSLALAFSQMSSAGKLMGQDLLQMINAGFSPLEEISRKTGKSIGELKNEMSKGAISSKMVQDAFISATSAGGKFFGMSAEGAKTLNGQISMLEESFDNMFNEIGSKGEGVVMSAVQIGTKLVENYEHVGKVLAGLVVTYGAYKTALVLSTQMTNGMTMAQVLHTTVTKALTVAEEVLNKTILANPYVLAAVALGTLITAVVLAGDSMTAAERAQDNYNKKIEENSKLVKDEKDEIDKLIGTLEDETSSIESKNIAFNTLITKYPTIFGKYKTEKDLIDHLTEARQRENSEIERKTALLGQKSYNESKTRATELNRLKYLQNHGDIKGRQTQGGYKKGKDQDEYLMLWNKYHDDIKKTQTWYGTEGGAIDRLASVATEEYKININENRKTQIAKYNANVVNLSKAQAQKELAKLRSGLREMDKSGKNYLRIGNNEPLNRAQIKERITLLEDNVKTERKTMAQWRKDARKETKKNRKTAKDLASSTELLTKDQAEKKMKAANDTLATSEKAEKNFDIQDKSDGKAQKEREKAAKKAQKEREKAQKAREKATKAAEKAKKAREIAAKNHQKSLNDLDSKKITKSQALVELENQVEQTRIDALQKGSEKTIAAMKLAHKKELEQIDKQKQEYLKKKQDEAEAEFKANPNNKDKTFNRSTVTLSASENAKFDEMLANIKIKHANENKELEVQRLQALYDYLKEYGTVQQQMYAIAKEYDEKIAKEKDENRRKILEKEKASTLAKSNTGNLALDIDWGATFGGIGGVLKDIAKDTLKEVEQYMRTVEFKALSPSDKKAYIDLQEKLRKEGAGEATSPFKFSQWAEIEKQTKAYQDSVRNLQEKTKAHTKAIEDLEKAEKLLTNATTDSSRKIAQAAVDAARVKVDTTANDLNNAKEDKNNKQGNLTNSTNKAIQGLNNFSSALQQMSNGTLKGFADGIANLISSIAGKGGVGGLIGTIGGKAGGLIGAILQIIDALGDDPAGFIKGILDKVAKVVETVLQQIPRIVLDVIKGVGNIIGGIISGISSWFAGGGNEKEMEKEISKLTKANEKLAQTIEDLSKNIGKKDNTNKQSIESYKKAKAAEDEWEANQRRAIDARASEWTNKGYGFLGIGGKGSFNAHSKSRDWWGWNEFNKRLSELGSKAKVFSSTDMWKLSPNEMKTLQETADTAWREFFDNGGHKSPEDLVKEYIERSGKKEELVSALNEKLTGQSWDGFMDSYKSVLKNLESTTEDFTNNINELISNALLESFSNEELKPKIKELYEYIAKAAEDGLDDSEIAYIRNRNDEIAALGLKKRSELEQVGLIKKKDSEQNASANGVSSITFEQASNIIALTTAGNISRDQIKDLISTKISTIDITVRGMQSLMGEQRNIADEIRTHQVNSYLELQGIHDDTSAMNKTLKMLSSDVSDIKKNIKDM